MTKNIKFVITRFVFQAQNTPKIRGPRWGAYDALPNPPVIWGGGIWGGGYPLPIPLPVRTRHPQFSGPPQHKILATSVKTGYANS